MVNRSRIPWFKMRFVLFSVNRQWTIWNLRLDSHHVHVFTLHEAHCWQMCSTMREACGYSCAGWALYLYSSVKCVLSVHVTEPEEGNLRSDHGSAPRQADVCLIHSQGCEGPLVKKLLTDVKSRQGLYAERCGSFNLSLTSVRDKSLDNSSPKSQRCEPGVAEELAAVSTSWVGWARAGAKPLRSGEL